MLSESAQPLDPSPQPSLWPRLLTWLAVCVVCGLLIAPVFHGMPPRVKFIGLHAWALAACVGAACRGAAAWQGIRSRPLIGSVSVLMAMGAVLLLALWGHQELKRSTSARVPIIPLPQLDSPEQMAQSLSVQRDLADAMEPTFTDFQRRRMNSPALRRIRPLVIWSGELLVAAVVSFLVSGVCLMKPDEPRRETEV